MDSIGQRMKELREASRLSQADIANCVAATKRRLPKRKPGKKAPSVNLLIWWADYFDVSMDYLCCRTDQPQGKLYECKPKMNISGDEMKKFIEMCFDPKSPFNEKLKETLLTMMGEQEK